MSRPRRIDHGCDGPLPGNALERGVHASRVRRPGGPRSRTAARSPNAPTAVARWRVRDRHPKSTDPGPAGASVAVTRRSNPVLSSRPRIEITSPCDSSSMSNSSAPTAATPSTPSDARAGWRTRLRHANPIAFIGGRAAGRCAAAGPRTRRRSPIRRAGLRWRRTWPRPAASRERTRARCRTATGRSG